MEDQITYDAGIWDDGYPDTVTVPCIRCGDPITAQLDRGELTTRDHPGVPPSWYVPEDEGCACQKTYTNEEAAAFEAACDRAAYATEA